MPTTGLISIKISFPYCVHLCTVELLPSPSSQAKCSVRRGGFLLPLLTEPNQHSSSTTGSINGPQDKEPGETPTQEPRGSLPPAQSFPSRGKKHAGLLLLPSPPLLLLYLPACLL